MLNDRYFNCEIEIYILILQENRRFHFRFPDVDQYMDLVSLFYMLTNFWILVILKENQIDQFFGCSLRFPDVDQYLDFQ